MVLLGNVHDKRVDQTSESATFLHNASSLHLTSIFSITQYGYLFKGSQGNSSP